MDKSQIISIIREVKAIDFMDSMNGLDKGLEYELLELCNEYYSDAIGGKKSHKDMKLKGIDERLNKMDVALKNIEEEDDEHYKFLVSIGLVFDDNVITNFNKIKDRLKYRRSKEVEEEVKEHKERTVFILEDQVVSLSHYFKFRIPMDISLVELVSYIKKSKEINDG